MSIWAMTCSSIEFEWSEKSEAFITDCLEKSKITCLIFDAGSQ